MLTANRPPGGDVSGCLQQISSLADTPNDEENLKRLREITTNGGERTLGKFKENERETNALSQLGPTEAGLVDFPASRSWRC